MGSGGSRVWSRLGCTYAARSDLRMGVSGLMMTVGVREIVAVDTLQLPPCPLPRPGDSVIWYEDSVRQHGRLLGSTYEGHPYIQMEDGGTDPVDSFDSIRVEKPDQAVGPMWLSLPADGTICRPTTEECDSLMEFTRQIVPPGRSHYELACEIWMRGFEVFFDGPQVREILAGKSCGEAELVTTMPLDRLRRIVLDMYGERQTDAGEVNVGELARRAGRFRVGGLDDTTDPYMEIRTFRYSRPGTIVAIYGASFERDMAFGDFSCNALYFDPINQVLIDPSGHGLDDARVCCLRPVLNDTLMSVIEKALIGLRIIRQSLMNYTLCPGYETRLLSLVRDLPAVPRMELAAALQAEVIDRLPEDPAKVLREMEAFFVKFGMKEIWDKNIQPCLEDLKP
jgi:hypothetical protein